MPLLLDGKKLTLEDVVRVARDGETVELSPEALARIDKCRAMLERKIEAREIMYGINTGIGELSEVVLKDDQVSNSGTSTLILANEYALSKRTTVYGQVAFANADAAAGLRTSVVAGGTAADKNTRVLNVGIKHAF